MNEVVVGTYEGFLLGYSVSNEGEIKKFKQTFATQSHTSSVRCIDTAGKFLASGGTDDKVVVIDLKTRKEHTVLMHHDGTITALAFTKGGTHLITGSSDGSIVMLRAGNWQIEKIWKKAHGGLAVNAISVHPSDKLALSIGGDKTLRTWNLVKGRPAFTINLSSKGVNMATEISWAPGGDRFSVISEQTVDVWTITKAGVEKRITCNSKPTCATWITDNRLIVGLENGNIVTLTVSDTQALTCTAHKQRVKCLHYENDSLYTASSSGEIKVWNMSDDNSLVEQCTAKAGCRITCMVLNKQSTVIKKEDVSDSEIKSEEEQASETENGDNEHELTKRKVVLPSKRSKVSSFVSVTYGNQNEQEPPEKKIKNKKKTHKKFKSNYNQNKR